MLIQAAVERREHYSSMTAAAEGGKQALHRDVELEVIDCI
jgi:hypothetical protein